MVTGVSAMPWESFARVLPVQGAMTSASKSFFGPMGSTAAMVQSGSRPHISLSRKIYDSALPNRLSILPALSDKIRGHIVASCKTFDYGKNRCEGAK